MKCSLASNLIHAGFLFSMMGVSVHGGDCCLVNEHQSFTPPAADANDRFGSSVSIHGMRLVIGAPFGDTALAQTSGEAYVYVLDSSGVWVLNDTVDAGFDAMTGDQFGAAVDIDAERVIVGAPRHDDLLLENAGAAYVFKEQSGNWVLEQKLAASDPESLAEFGHSVAVDGELAVVGSAYDDNPDAADSGSIYVFRRNSSGIWSQEAKFVGSNVVADRRLGWSVAIDGDVIVAGAPQFSLQTTIPGKAHVFRYLGQVGRKKP